MNTQPQWAGGSYAGEQGVDSTRARPTLDEPTLMEDLVPDKKDDSSEPTDIASRRASEDKQEPPAGEDKAEDAASESSERDDGDDDATSRTSGGDAEGAEASSVPPKPARRPGKKMEEELSGTVDDLLRTAQPEGDGPASEGLRGAANKFSFGLLKVKPSEAEREDRKDLKDIRSEWSGLKTFACANSKGDAGKSLTTAMACATFGLHRGGGVLAADYNEAVGTMGLTAEQGRYDLTITEALRDAGRFESGNAHRGEWSQYVRQQSTHYDVLAADEEPSHMMMIGDAEVERIHSIARRYYSIIGCDTGNIPRTSAWNAVMRVTDQLVVPVDLGLKTSVNAGRMFDQLESQGLGDLVKGAIIVVSGTLGTSDSDAAKRRRDALAYRARAVVEIPFDKELTTDRPALPKLAPITRRAYRKLAAEIARGFNDLDSRLPKTSRH